mmetsp:Transcript_31545/g.66359  ORF Transcript_31545/g.66359 Transcript_31545/m.66359 type:complete len:332 (-) Transcript_31545:2227-3222(-)
MPIPQNRSKPRQQVPNRRSHLRHTNHIHNGSQRPQNGTKNIRIFFTKVLIQHNAQVTHELLLPTCLHNHRNPPNEIGSLHTHTRRLVVKTPFDCACNLLQVGFTAFPQSVDDGSKAIEHDLPLLAECTGCSCIHRLLLEGIENTINETFLQPVVNIAAAQIFQHFLSRFHDHASVRFRIILEIINDTGQNVRTPHLVRKLFGGLDHLLVIPPIQCHPPNPKIAKELWQYLLPNVFRLDARRSNALFYHLEDNALHFLIGTVKFPRQYGHDKSGIMTGIILLHEGNHKSNSLEERRKSLPMMLHRSLPQSTNYRIKALNPIRMRRLRQRRDS